MREQHSPAVPRDRYTLTREPAPTPRPRWWQSRWGIVDRLTSDRAVIEWFFHFGSAERRVRCLNGTAPVPSHCGNSAPAASHQERWSMAA